ncbi:outer membrane protein [Brucella gallinifaecis]|uniref:outer membrane protein n=1 Tax=Brucella gallinifaecis TaxID=215590 RepID=UPI00235E5680|nr:outer membrane protein [Brucella gallinifaecis]
MKRILTSAAIVLVSTSAYAADAIVEEPVAVIAPDTFSWTGGYIGINAGYAGGKFKNDFDNFAIATAVRAVAPYELQGSWEDNASGFVGGVQAGYNWQFENGFVLGAEADFQGSTLKSKNSAFDGEDLYYESSEITTKVQWWGTVRARLGYTPVERLLVYGTGGLAYGNIKTSYNYQSGYDGQANQDIGFSSSKTKAGWTIGGGAEYAITNNWTLKSEYLYTDLGKAKGQAKLYDFDWAPPGEYSSSVKFHTVRVGLNYKF